MKNKNYCCCCCWSNWPTQTFTAALRKIKANLIFPERELSTRHLIRFRQNIKIGWKHWNIVTSSIDTSRPSRNPYRSFKSKHRSPAGSSVRVIMLSSLVYHYFELDIFPNERSRYSDSQKVNFFLIWLLVELFSYAQQFIKDSKRFYFSFTRDFICMLSCLVSPHDELFSELLGQTCFQICLNKKNKNKKRKKKHSGYSHGTRTPTCIFCYSYGIKSLLEIEMKFLSLLKFPWSVRTCKSYEPQFNFLGKKIQWQLLKEKKNQCG